jgi:hypothetical protein
VTTGGKALGMGYEAVAWAGKRKALMGCSSAAPAPGVSAISPRMRSKRTCGGPKRYGSVEGDEETEDEENEPLVRSLGAGARALCNTFQLHQGLRGALVARCACAAPNPRIGKRNRDDTRPRERHITSRYPDWHTVSARDACRSEFRQPWFA